MDFDGDADRLLIWSQDSNEVSEANGVCQCRAYQNEVICCHRVAKRLIERYNAALLDAWSFTVPKAICVGWRRELKTVLSHLPFPSCIDVTAPAGLWVNASAASKKP